MKTKRSITQVLDQDYLAIRARILDLAAALDRLNLAHEPPHHPPDRRLAEIRTALEALLEPDLGRAETIQRIFSLEYDPHWRTRFELSIPPR